VTADYWNMNEAEIGKFFGGMRTDESDAFFHNYLVESHARMEALREEFQKSQATISAVLDFNPASLIPLWSWASGRLQKRQWTEAEKPKNDLRATPGWEIRDFRPFADQSLRLLGDVAYYFAEVFIRNHPGVSWEVCRIGDPDFADENQPVLSGFIVPMNPRTLLRVVAKKTFDHRVGELALYDLYNTWVRNLVVVPPEN